MEVIVAEIKELDDRAIDQLSTRWIADLIDTTKDTTEERCVVSPQEYQWLNDYIALTEQIEMLAQPYIYDRGIKIIEKITNKGTSIKDDIVIPFYLALLIEEDNKKYNHLKEEWERLQTEKEKLPDIWFM